MRENLTWKVVLILVLVGLAGLIVALKISHIKLGFDLMGGVELVYKVEGVVTPEEQKTLTPAELQKRREEVSTLVSQTVDVIRKRLDPNGILQPDIRAESGGEIVIRLQGLSQTEVDHIKRLAESMGELQFRMVIPKELYNSMPTEQRKTVQLMTLTETDEDKQTRTEQLWIQLHDDYDITGEYLLGNSVGKNIGVKGVEVAFRLNPIGSKKFASLTRYLADHPTATGTRRLAILLNGTLQSAPHVEKEIDGGAAVITGMPATEVEDTIAVLQAGSLPTRLTYESEMFIGPELGADALAKGKTAILWSVILVLAFMCVYYALSGVIADFAVALNLLFLFAVLLVSDSVLTLPGIAGMALTVGMAVDANVLINERIREELAAGKVLRFAIKAGYERAFLVIFDSNLTTVITAVALWVFLTGPVRWFAVTLTIGLVASMFTSLFVTRVVFDLLVGAGWVKRLRMMQLFRNPRLRFIRWAPMWMTLSAAAIVLGMVAFVMRGRENLGIDFAPGSAAQLQLKDNMTMPIEEVRKIIYGLGYDNAQVVTAKGAASQVSETESNQFVIRIPQKSANESPTERAEVLHNIEQAFAAYVPQQEIKVQFDGATLIDKNDPAGGQLVTVSFFWVAKEQPAPTQAKPGELAPAAGTPEVKGTEAPAKSATTPQTQPEATGTPEAGTVAQKLEPASLSTETIEEALKKSGLPNAELVKTENRRFYLQAQFKTTESSVDKITQAVTAPGLIVIPHAFVYEQFVGPAQAHKMIIAAVAAILVSMFFIVIYVGVRFGSLRYGFAAITALAHDVLITLGAIAVASYLAGTYFGNLLQLGQVDIDLNVVAAVLTIIGYSLNDTIVVFDRIRENRGRRREVSAELIDRSVNQTLSRTTLTAFTTLLVCLTLYLFGGRQLHGLAFCLTVGIIVGTYSSVFIASPLLIVTHMGVSDTRSEEEKSSTKTA